MSKTTKGMKIPEQLRQLAKWFEEGKEIEYKSGDRWYPAPYVTNEISATEYRAKPEKPMVLKDIVREKDGSFIELTPEVIQALKDCKVEY